MTTPYRPGERLTADDVNKMMEAARALDDIRSELDPDDTIILPLVDGVTKWNERRAEISINSFTYHRLVSLLGEKNARNCLMPGKVEQAGQLGPPISWSTNETAGGIELEYSEYPDCKDIDGITYGNPFFYLTSDPEYVPDFVTTEGSEGKNGFCYDQYTPGKLVYVHPGEAGYLLTNIPTKDSFPCIIRQGPFCNAWYYNTATCTRSAAGVKESVLSELKTSVVSVCTSLGFDRDAVDSAINAAEKAYKVSDSTDNDAKLSGALDAFAAALNLGAREGTQAAYDAIGAYLRAIYEEYEEEVYRFANRPEMLVSLARGLLEHVLGVTFETTYAEDADGAPKNEVVVKMGDRYILAGPEHADVNIETIKMKLPVSEDQMATAVPRMSAGLGPEVDSTWRNAIVTNMAEGNYPSFLTLDKASKTFSGDRATAGEAVASVVNSSISLIAQWLCNAYDGKGHRIPYTSDAIGVLSFLVDRTYALYQATSVLLVVQPLVPGKSYDLFVDPSIVQIAEGQEDSEEKKTAGIGSMKWDGNRLVPFDKESEEQIEKAEKEVGEYNNLSVEAHNRQVARLNEEFDRTFATAEPAVVQTTPPSFHVTHSSAAGANRTPEQTTLPGAVASKLRAEVFRGKSGGSFRIVISPSGSRKKAEKNPWNESVSKPITLNFMEVHPGLGQRNWLRLLYCSDGRTTDISEKKLYSVFGGKKYVPLRAGTGFANYVSELNEARKKSRFVTYDGVLNTKTGEFWCSDTNEIYGGWFNITANRASKTPCLSDADGVNVIYTYRVGSLLFGDELCTETYKNQSGRGIGLVLAKRQAMLFGGDPTKPVPFTGGGTLTDQKLSTAEKEAYKSASGGDSAEGSITPSVTEIQPTKSITTTPPEDDGGGDSGGGSGGDDSGEGGGDSGGGEGGGGSTNATNYQDINKVVDPSMASDIPVVTAVFDPPKAESTTTVVEKVSATRGIVRLPIVSMPLRDKTVAPRVNGPLNSKGESIYDGATYPTIENSESVSYSFLVAKCMGLVELADSKPTYQAAYYSSQDEDRIPFWVEDSPGLIWLDAAAAEGGGGASMAAMFKSRLGQRLGAARKSSGIYDVDITKQFAFGDHTVFCGTYMPEDREKKSPVYYDLTKKGDERKQCQVYVQRVCVKGQYYDKTGGISDCSWGDESYPSFHAFEYQMEAEGDDAEVIAALLANNTAGWISYAYYDELEENPTPEIFSLSPPKYMDFAGNECTISVRGNEWVYRGAKDPEKPNQKKEIARINPVYITPFATMYSKKARFGSAVVSSIDKKTKKAYIAFRPSVDKKGEKSPTTYNQIWSFPFEVDGFPLPALPMLTTMQHKAQRSDYVPAICPLLDQNEVLTPGTIVEVTKKTVALYTDKKDSEQTESTNATEAKRPHVDFVYYSVDPPESYSTCSEGTPFTKIYRFNKQNPTPEDLKDRLIEPDDLWITSITSVPRLPACEVHGSEYYVGVMLSHDGTPRIRQPYGVFNDCDNQAHLGLFIKRTPRGLSYPSTFHIDYVPYGYAIPAKTPACYYRISGEKCAANIISPQYILKRVGDDQNGSKLELTGACYVPGSSLTVLG